jgi:excisionase family DNA binding protein
MFITPKKFSEKTGENYDLILELCKNGTLKCEQTEGGHFKIYKSELDKHLNKRQDFVSREDYECVIRENERLKCFISQLKNTIESACLIE